MKIIQVIDALIYGDGVSKDLLKTEERLTQAGYTCEIYCRFIADEYKDVVKDITTLKTEEDDIIIHHYSGTPHVLDEVKAAKAVKVLKYHNITPDYFFHPEAEITALTEGEKILAANQDVYDYWLADSKFNALCLTRIGINKKIDVMPIYIDFSDMEKYRTPETKIKTFLFVGRLAGNKKHEDILKVFEYYYTHFSADCELYFAGNYEEYEQNHKRLLEIIKNYCSKRAIHFTGKISNEELSQLYNRADIFLCMSEHEGFCIPLIESMYYEIPTVAYDACVVSETMGNAGVLLKDKDPRRIAQLCYLILHDAELRQSIIECQNKRILEFSEEKMSAKLFKLVDQWRNRK